MSLKTLRNLFLILALMVVAMGVGYRAGARGVGREILQNTPIVGNIPVKPTSVDFSLFWDVWDRLNRYYIDKKALDYQKMVYGAISGVVSSLGDPYTVFLPPDQNQEVKDDLGGKFEGIGAQLGIKDKKIVIVAPLKGTPAEKSGLRAGDWIVKVDGKDTSNWTLPEAVSKIRGTKGSSVVLNILHKDGAKPVDISVMRDTISVASVEWETLKFKNQSSIVASESGKTKIKIVKDDCTDCGQVIDLRLTRFGDQTTDEWNKAVTDIKTKIANSQNKIKGLVFDLRNNPGGYLSGSIFIASEFLKDGTVVTQESIASGKQSYEVDRKGKFTDIPMVVLVNKGSASASEIVAGALQVRGRAKIVGEASFGKGSVQEAQELPGGAGIHITTAKWLLPNGKWINGSGITPDIKVENDDNKSDEDLQLETAIETLVK
ncbi:S41 family peptidase [Candidatus Gottesmanbacteria bacterium]|nr:S41 family peptidase [Candidatus Gottesmanbacteria bacterium]